jgi:hypothetical protein
MKKLLSAACVACFALSLCVGCGDTSTTKKSTSVTTSPSGSTQKTESSKSGDGAAPKGDTTPPK